MIVGRYDYPSQFPEIDRTVAEIRDVLLSGRYVLGREVEAFERQFGAFLGVDHVVGVNSGTDGLILSLMALGIGRGDEVITQANTFYATVAAIRFVGARPVLVDPVEDTALIDPEAVAEAITERTRAIIPVHLFGKATDLGPLRALAKRHGLAILEDAAQCHGARAGGVMAGTQGDIASFSFHPSKNLAAAGDAGAIATSSPVIAEKLRALRALGQKRQNDHVVLGMNSKLDTIQAIVLSAKLPMLAGWNEERRAIAARYRVGLGGMPLRFQQWDQAAGEEHVFHLFQIRTGRRDALLAYLEAAGIDAVVRYPVPIHLQPAFADQGWRPGQFPIAEALANECLCLPLRPGQSAAQTDHVIDQVAGFFARHG